jgi:hypothetical protein
MVVLLAALLAVTGQILFLALLHQLAAVVVKYPVELVDVMAVPAAAALDYF